MNRSHVRACAHYESPLGRMLLAAAGQGLAGVWFVGQRHGPDATGWPEDNPWRTSSGRPGS